MVQNSGNGEQKAHHTKKGFCNLEPFHIRFKDLLKWNWERKLLPPVGGYKQFIKDWFQPADFTATNNGIWWLGHATSLIRIQNKTILTDPVFSKRASPFRFIGPKRRTPCPARINDLPNIDVITISHNHYDHLDYYSMKRLIKRFPSVTIITPLGLKNKLMRWGAKQVIELDWWDSVDVNGIKLTATPAHHWSQRTMFDKNRSLWCGWMIEYAEQILYFMGDTGYADFSAVKTNFPHIDVALIPIGSYAPRWFMSNQHIDPEHALQLYEEIGCKRAIGVHWGVFELADDPLDEPPNLLKSLLVQKNLNDTDFSILKIGAYIPLNINNETYK